MLFREKNYFIKFLTKSPSTHKDRRGFSFQILRYIESVAVLFADILTA